MNRIRGKDEIQVNTRTKMETQMRTPFTPFQMKLLAMSQRIKSEEEEKEIQALLANYFADKAQKEVDRLIEIGVINDEIIESWKHEHMRTVTPNS